jgi:hypothetical protein
MKPIVLSLLVLPLAAFAVGQKGVFRFSDLAKKVETTAQEGRFAQLKNGGVKVILTGNVVVKDNGEKMELRAQKIDADISQGAGKPSELQKAVATGKVRITKVVTNPTGVQTTQIDGSRANFQAGADQSVVDLAGPVTIRNTDSAKKETLLATGSQGKAFLAKGPRTNQPNALNRAELRGNVRTVVTQKAQGGGKLIATGGNMVLEQGAKTRTITMTQNVNIDGSGSAQQFSASNMQRVVMVLDNTGQVLEWEAR